jgi:lipopolysaccharide export LptBFGC system permease protein LptF
MRTPVLFAVLLSLACLYVNDNVSPEAAYSRSLRRKAFRATDIMALLEPRTWVPFGKYDLFVARRDGETLQDLRVNEALSGGRTREIRAATARIETNGAGRAVLMMSDVTIDPWRDNAPGMSHADVWQLPLSALTGRAEDEGETDRDPVRRAKDMPTWALVRDVAIARIHPPVGPGERARIAALEARLAKARAELADPSTAAPSTNAVVASGEAAASAGPPDEAELANRVDVVEKRLKRVRADLAPRFRREREISRAKVEIGVRATLAAACLCFVLVGIPLGMQSHRRQSSVGIGISLAIAGAFYIFCIAAESLSKHPELHAHWLLPVPVVVCAVLGAVLIRRRD